MRYSLKGEWVSETLKKIPNYNSNFTNWVDCICYKGQIKIEIFEEAEDGLVMKVHVPVIYYGGIEGYACLNKYSVDESNKCIRELTTRNEITKFVVIDEDTLLMRNIYNEERKFSRLR